MWPWTRRVITPVGVEIDGSAVRLAQVEFRSGRPPALTVLHRALPAAAATDEHTRLSTAIGMLRRMLAEGAFVGRRIVASLPDHLVHLRTVRLAHGRSIALDAAVRLEAPALFPGEIKRLQLQYIEAGQTRYGAEARDEVIVAASHRGEVERLLVEFGRAGLDVAALDLAPCAAYRACRGRAGDEREIHAALDLGRVASHVVIGKGGQVRFIKRIAIGTEHLVQAVSRRLGIADEEAAKIRRRVIGGAPDTPDRQAIRRAAAQASRPLLESLAAEVSSCLRYYCVSFRGRAPQRLLVSGRDAADPQLGAVLSAALSVPVQLVNPLADFEIRSGLAICEANEWSTALGLAIKSAASAAQLGEPDVSRTAGGAIAATAVTG